MNDEIINPVDWFNFYGSFSSIFEGVKGCNFISDGSVSMINPKELDKSDSNNPTFVEDGFLVKTLKFNPLGIATNSLVSKFMMLTMMRFKGDSFAAMSYVAFFYMKHDIPYIRVGTDYFKLIKKEDRWGSTHFLLKAWKKDEIKEDHTKQMLQLVFKYDDFTILPNNKQFIPVKNNCYNLYSKFTHSPFNGIVIEDMIKTTIELMAHIFGEQIELGFKYLKVLYENPRQILPILALVSTERETGKTTFLNWIQMIFGDNTVLISPQDLASNHNSGYATKNIIMIDETVIEKSTSIEKLKSLATAKQISVNPKFVQQYSVPFFGKIIVCTNKEKDFMRIDEEEIRFWIRKIKPVTGKKNTNIEQDLFNEIPYLLAYLECLPEIDYTNSRMVFTQDEIKTSELEVVKEESRSQLRKEIEILIEEHFNNSKNTSFEATPIDIKERWFKHNNQVSISYIRKVLKDEMKIKPNKVRRYRPFNEITPDRVGATFEFHKTNFDYIIESQQIIENNDEFEDLPF